MGAPWFSLLGRKWVGSILRRPWLLPGDPLSLCCLLALRFPLLVKLKELGTELILPKVRYTRCTARWFLVALTK